MSNIESAKTAIEAEIAHAKQGIAHFSARVEALEKALMHIVAVDGGVLDTQRRATTSIVKKVKAGKAKPTKAAKASKTGKGKNELPSTGGNYWSDLITENPQSSAEVLQAAVSRLGFAPSKEQVLKLTQRMTFALNAMVKAGKIKDSGRGRERRFFKG